MSDCTSRTPRRITVPEPPSDFTVRACSRPDLGDSHLVLAAAERIHGSSLAPRMAHEVLISACPLTAVPAWIRHHVGEAYRAYSQFVARGGTEYCPDLDDPAEVCDRMAALPEGLMPRLSAAFEGLEREADPEAFFRNWYTSLSRRYDQAMQAARMESGSDTKRSHQRSLRIVKDTVPDFSQFFDCLRDFIGRRACVSGGWNGGDSWRCDWDMDRFTRPAVWR